MSMNEDADLMKVAKDAVSVMGAIQEPTELAALLVLLRDRNVRNMLEIGSEAGGTFYAFCKVTNPEGKKISLDLPTGASGSCRFASPEAYTNRVKLMSSFAKDSWCIAGDSHSEGSKDAVESLLNGELLDFLFIDGDHSCNGVQQDWDMYSPLVRPGGLVAFHDIKDSAYHRHHGCYVADCWHQLKGKHKAEIRSGQQDWGGIGVVFV